MLMKTKIFVLSLFVFAYCFQSCGNKSDFPSAEEVLSQDKIEGSSLYYNPISADKPLSKEEAPQMKFEEDVFHFGNLKDGEIVTHEFVFKNTGKAPLVISNATGSCGCTVPEYPKEPIAPGKKGKIKVSFNSTGKEGAIEKYVTILANTVPNRNIITIKARVQK